METTETVGSLGEFQLIERFFAPSGAPLPEGVIVGPGDDAAVVTVPRTQQLVVTTDTLVEGVHFFHHADPFLLGQKTLQVNLSDIAAMAAQPRWCLLSLSLPASTPLTWVEAFSRGLRSALDQSKEPIALIGGNITTTHTGITATLTLMGLVIKGRATTRGSAQVGDRIFVSGTIGDAALGLDIQTGARDVVDQEAASALLKRLNRPAPPVELALALQDAALTRAAIDLSDGLIADLEHLCRASQVGANVDAGAIPLSAAADAQVRQHGLASLTRILSGGEDYELLFTVSPTAVQAVQRLATKTATRVTDIGAITAQPGLVVTHRGQTLTMHAKGWKHF